MNARLPGSGILRAKVALMRTFGSVLMIPRQLGPMSGMPAARTASRNRSSSFAPSSPVSLKPAEISTIALTPAAAASATTSRTAAAGTTTTARSAGFGVWRSDG